MKTTYCNPVDLEYRFQQPGRDALEPCREGSDPAVLRYRGRYYLCPSKTEGLFVSDDLARWRYLPGHFFDAEGYGPDLWERDGSLFLATGFVTTTAFRTQNPEAGAWEPAGIPWCVGDPKFFPDDDGRMYLYYGCSPDGGLYAVEVDPETHAPRGETVRAAQLDEIHCGWHRPGEDNAGDPGESPGVTAVRTACLGAAPLQSWLEGAWMTKHDGVYYLQSSQPCTEFNIYSDDIYRGPSPLGPFEPQPDNPFSFKPGGFITGAGHSSTFTDGFGNYFHAATMRIAARHIFERRVGIFPAGFLPDGTMYCKQRFGDYPHYVPDRTLAYGDDSFTGWMLLSCRAAATASSAQPGHPAEYACDEDIRSDWVAHRDDPAPWLAVDLKTSCRVMAVQLNFSESGCDRYGMRGNPAVYRWILEAAETDGDWQPLYDASEATEDRTHVYCPLAIPVTARYLRVRIRQTAAGGAAAVSGFRVFGLDGSGAPAAVTDGQITRDRDDRCVVHLRWTLPDNAHGVNLRWGLAPDRLHHTWQCYRETEKKLRCLDARQDYFFAFEAFGKGGVAPLGPIVAV